VIGVSSTGRDAAVVDAYIDLFLSLGVVRISVQSELLMRYIPQRCQKKSK